MEKLERYIYLAAPYSDPSSEIMQQRYEQINHIAACLIKEGWTVYSPISHCHEIANTHGLPTDAAFWRKTNRIFIKQCMFVVVLMLPGWKDSVGIKEEIEAAKELNIPVCFLTPECKWYYPRVR